MGSCLMQEAIESYARLIKDIEEEIVRLQDFYGNSLHCRPGCDDCCMAISVLPVEAVLLRLAYDNLNEGAKLSVRRQAGKKNDKCPFLIQKKCCIYKSRPLICRTHGLPIAYVNAEIETIEVSACLVNFPADMRLEKEGLLFMDPFNERLAEINLKVVQEKEKRRERRYDIRQIILDENLL